MLPLFTLDLERRHGRRTPDLVLHLPQTDAPSGGAEHEARPAAVGVRIDIDRDIAGERHGDSAARTAARAILAS
jgi:hypothetical protein